MPNQDSIPCSIPCSCPLVPFHWLERHAPMTCGIILTYIGEFITRRNIWNQMILLSDKKFANVFQIEKLKDYLLLYSNSYHWLQIDIIIRSQLFCSWFVILIWLREGQKTYHYSIPNLPHFSPCSIPLLETPHMS